ncbi:non-structural maintenance of chromosomes element 4 homolog A-like [Pyrus communis]|uniref:non-structural maintenance of chromosomes element 4 homolog A-like n=1 Tax=Pyrus communis TaxID=23211 RepID=UPI0035BF5347
MVKREFVSSGSGGRDEIERPQAVPDRRALRSRYFNVKSIIHDKREDITKVDSEKFNLIINEVESLHELVQNPREQVADAEALLDITTHLMSSVKAHNKEGITTTGFVNCILKQFEKRSQSGSSSVSWKDIGRAVSHVYQKPPQCCTMIGPMSLEVKQRKSYVRAKRMKPTENDTPEELHDAVEEEQPETVKNVSAMFNILRKKRRVRFENLVLNGNSFAQTVENIFALSFLVKDGRAELKLNEEGHHLVLPRNAPSAEQIASGEITYRHFVFRFDFQDWKFMKEIVGDGEQLMPRRTYEVNKSSDHQGDLQCKESQTTPIRKLSRNRGLVMQEQPVGEGMAEPDTNQSIVEDSPVRDDAQESTNAIRKGKRKMM